MVKSALRAMKRNWEFVVQTIIVLTFIGILVADHFGRATLDSSTIGTTVVALLYFASFKLVRHGEELATARGELNSMRQITELSGEIRQLPGDRISDALKRLLNDSDEWHFRGGSARWQLECVLPQLAEQRDLPARYVMQVIDPRDDHLCTRYGQYRATSRARDDAPSITDGPAEVRRDLLASIYAAGWYQLHSQVRPEVTFLKTFSPLRIDIGRKGLMVTVARKSAPGLFAENDTWYYRSVLDELAQLETVSARLRLPREPSLLPADLQKVDASHVKEMLKKVLVEEPDGVTSPLSLEACQPPIVEDDYRRIADKIKRSKQ